MPNFAVVPMDEAVIKTATGKRAQLSREYASYIEQLREGAAGRLQASEGETVAAIRRRLGAAARLTGKNLVIRRTGEEVYFWVQTSKGAPVRRGRGRPRKVVA